MFLEIRHLQSLAAIRDSGGVAQAAERLHLTQSALSHQIKALEDRCGGTLFVRKSRPVMFTPLGRHFLALAERVLPEVERAEREGKRLAGGAAGRLYIAIDCHSCIDWLLPSMDAYRERWPEVELDLSLSHSFNPLPALLDGSVDLVITSDPENHPRLRFVRLFRYQSVLIMANNHPLAARKFIEPADLRDETVITYPVNEDRLDLYRAFLNPARVRPAARRTAELTSVIVQLVASGRGVAALPSWAVDKYLQAGYVSSSRLSRKGVWATLHAGCRREDADIPYVKGFVAQARSISAKTLTGIRPVL
ncbi:MAG TPA: LysR family transcriptional regulator [Gammaproteobacteria bacterium]|nr:LysR family transcriptional regulator [Gammaproteobacteria bacterium]